MTIHLPPVKVAHPHVVVDDGILEGSPHVYVGGARVRVIRIWVWHRKGVSVETLIKRYPSLGPTRVLDAISFGYDNEELVRADIAREDAALREEST